MGLEQSSPATVQALHLCGTFILNDKRELSLSAICPGSDMTARWEWRRGVLADIGCSYEGRTKCKLGDFLLLFELMIIQLGLHRDGAAFGLSSVEVEERRLVWWEILASHDLPDSRSTLMWT